MRTVVLFVLCLLTLGATSVDAQGKFSGYMFGDYFYNIARDTSFTRLPNSALPNVGSTLGSKGFQAFQIRRIYFAYDNDISEKFTTRFRLEGAFIASEGATAAASQLFIKDAYLRWKDVFSGSDLIFGVQPTSAYDVSESVWGFRSLEKTIMDLRGIISSRDLGVSLKGKIDEGGMFNYWLTVANNSSTNTENDKYKRFSAMLHLKPTKNIQVTVTGDYKDQANINDPKSTTVPPATISNAVLTGAAFVAYSDPESFTIGAEGFLQSTSNAFLAPGSTDLVARKAIGVSVFAVCNVKSDLALVGRFDYFDPNSDGSSKGDSRNYILGGVSWKPNKNVSLIPNIQVETYEAAPTGGRTYDASITGRLTFYYVFL